MTLAPQGEGASAWPLPIYLPPGAFAIASLRPGLCRWPIGDADQDGFRFCLAPAPRHAYCAAHRHLARRRAP